jgi:hypothetical protein
MPYLGDYLGQLLSEITIARVQADLEAVRIAELYANHPLLKHLPVPHFRLPTVAMNVPVVIKETEESRPGESPRGGVALPVLREHFDNILDMHLKRAKIRLTDAEKARLNQALDDTISRLTQPPYVSISIMTIADELVSTVLGLLALPERRREAIKTEQLKKWADEFRATVRLEFLNLRTEPPRLHVLVTTTEVREAGPQEILAHLNLSISEEAVEWTVIESQGKTYNKLIPE